MSRRKRNHNLAIIEGWLSIITNTILFVFKYWIGILSGSIAIISDAWHTLSDSISSIILLIGARVITKPADEQHPFGHGRAELITALIIGVFLAIVSFNFLMESIGRLQDHESPTYGIPAIIVITLSIITKEGLAQYAFWAGKRTGYKALMADGWHHRSDAIASVLILIGIFLAPYFWWIDGLLGIIVSLLIGYAAFDILKDTIHPLLGEEPSEIFVERIKGICHKHIEIPVDIHHIHVHKYGQHTELTFHIRLAGNITLEQAHRIASDIEDSLREELKVEPTIHMEPID